MTTVCGVQGLGTVMGTLSGVQGLGTVMGTLSGVQGLGTVIATLSGVQGLLIHQETNQGLSNYTSFASSDRRTSDHKVYSDLRLCLATETPQTALVQQT